MKKNNVFFVFIIIVIMISAPAAIFAATAEQAGYEAPCGMKSLMDPDTYLVAGDFALPVPIGWEASMVEVDNTEYAIMTSPNGLEIHLIVGYNNDPEKFSFEMYRYQSHAKYYAAPQDNDQLIADYVMNNLTLVDYN